MKPTETFKQLISTSYAFKENIFDFSSDWNLVQTLYSKNYIGQVYDECRIPKRIHQIWLGSKLPLEYKRYTETWKTFHPNWEYRLWTLDDLKDVEISKQDIFDRATSWAMKSDILRYEILRQYGGLYIDTDFECLHPFDNLTYLEFFTGISYDTKMELYNGLIACVPHHPVIEKCVTLLNRVYDGVKGSIILDVSGAYHFTRVFTGEVNLNTERVVVFPTQFFYPFPNNIRKDEKIDRYLYVKDYSYAIHHWAVSWSNKNRRK